MGTLLRGSRYSSSSSAFVSAALLGGSQETDREGTSESGRNATAVFNMHRNEYQGNNYEGVAKQKEFLCVPGRVE